MSPATFINPPTRTVHHALVALAVELGASIAARRQARGWSRQRLAAEAGVSRSLVYLVERGESTSIEAYMRLGSALRLRLDARLVDLRQRSAGGHRDEDPVHAAMGEVEARVFGGLGFELALDEPYQHFQFAGRADLVAWDRGRRALLHVENRTRFPNVQEALGAFGAKRAYLGPVLAERLGVGRWRSETHVIAALWSAEVLHVLRLRRATFRSTCPDPADAFAAWLVGRPPLSGRASTLVVLDPAAAGRQRRWIDIGECDRSRPRYRDYAIALAAIRAAGLA